MKIPMQKCPICNQMNVEASSRYPNLVCCDCFSKTTDKDGRKIYYFNDFAKSKADNNTYEWFGPGAQYIDTKESYNSVICYINGIECQAKEGRFGGIVIEAVSNHIERIYMSNREPYWKINREERFYAALLFSSLLSNHTNLGIFLNYLSNIKKLPDYDINQCELYYEYTYLRDLWFNIGRNNDAKKEMILSFLNLSNSNELRKLTVPEFNTFFGTSRPSNDDIMSPGTWSIPKYSSNITNNEEFKKICMFKWSFNAKPDLVIHLDKNNIVCIEAKLESGEGQYPSSQKDKDVFLKRINNLVSQTDLQKYMFENILKLKQFSFFLLKARTGQHSNEITWGEILNKLSVEHMHPFIQKGIITINNLSNSNNISDESNELS